MSFSKRPGEERARIEPVGWRQAGLSLTPARSESSRRPDGDLGKIRIGRSAWSDLGSFYPPGMKTGEQLPFHAAYFPIVEINTTYYAVPSRRTIEQRVTRTPERFLIDVTPPRELTSTPVVPNGVTPEPNADLARSFAAALEPLTEAGKLGAITFQFPPSYRNTAEHRDYLRRLPGLFPDYPIAVEFHRSDWLDEEHANETLRLLTEAGLSFTMVDEPQIGVGCVPPTYAVTNPRLALVRFHGRNTDAWYGFSGSGGSRFNWVYAESELAEWTEKIRRAESEAEAVHVFFNTNEDDQGPRNARQLTAQLGV